MHFAHSWLCTTTLSSACAGAGWVPASQAPSRITHRGVSIPAPPGLQGTGLEETIEPGSFYMVCNTSAAAGEQSLASTGARRPHRRVLSQAAWSADACFTTGGVLPGVALALALTPGCSLPRRLPAASQFCQVNFALAGKGDNPIACTATECGFRWAGRRLVGCRGP